MDLRVMKVTDVHAKDKFCVIIVSLIIMLNFFCICLLAVVEYYNKSLC